MVRQHLARPDAAASITKDLTADGIKTVADTLNSMGGFDSLSLIERVDIHAGTLRVQMNTEAVSAMLRCPPEHINTDGLTVEAPFQMRRRGVELKLYLGKPSPEVDQTLVQNIVKGQRWLVLILNGTSFPEIAKTENVSIRRVQDIAKLALIAPDILDAIAQGTQPEALTTNHLIKTACPADWSRQRDLCAAL